MPMQFNELSSSAKSKGVKVQNLESKPVKSNRMSQAVHAKSSFGKSNRLSSLAHGAGADVRRVGTMLTGGRLEEVVEESSEINPNRISDNATDEAIENFLAFTTPDLSNSGIGTIKKQDPETSTNGGGMGGFTQTRWHDQGSQALSNSQKSIVD